MNFLYVSNDVDMRVRIVSELSALLAKARKEGKLNDYKIVCDETNNAPEEIRAGDLSVDIYIKPMWSLNFIIWNFRINSNRLQTTYDFLVEDAYEDRRSKMLELCEVEI
jgi:phage tail sheath protein FI